MADPLSTDEHEAELAVWTAPHSGCGMNSHQIRLPSQTGSITEPEPDSIQINRVRVRQSALRWVGKQATTLTIEVASEL